MLKKHFKISIAAVLYYSGLLKFSSFIKKVNSPSGICTVLLYHRVVNNHVSGDDIILSQPGIVVTAKMFDEQLKFISAHYNVISMDKFIECLGGKGDFPENAMLITFDDGWRDNYRYAYPTLMKYEMNATIFLSAGYIGTTDVFWPEKIIFLLHKITRDRTSVDYEGDKGIPPEISEQFREAMASGETNLENRIEKIIGYLKGFTNAECNDIIGRIAGRAGIKEGLESHDRVLLDWGEIREMSQNGISFGAHGINHQILTGIDLSQQLLEIRESKKIIEENTGLPVWAFSYPNGDYDESIKRMVEENGYRCGFTVESGFVKPGSDPFCLPRLNIHEDNSLGPNGSFSNALFACRLKGIW